MPYFLVSDFKGGLDVRKSPWTAEAGTLQVFTDGHITRGAEIEKRKSFANVGSLLSATKSLVASRTASGRGLVVFGSAPQPAGLPAGVTYQRLQHPDGNVEMVDIAAVTLFDGFPYVAANFADGTQWHYYNGQLVTDWGAGVVRPGMIDNAGIAEHLRSLIDASPSYTATRSGNNVTIIGLPGVDYEISGSAINRDGGVDNQTLTISEVEAPITPVVEAKAIAEFAILEGSTGAANFIQSVRADVTGTPVELLTTTIPFNTSPEITALDVVVNINTGTASHGYSAGTKYGRIFIYAPSTGSAANGRVIEVTAKGNVILYEGRFAITGGTPGAGHEVTMARVNGANIMSGAVAWATSDSATAAAVASNIVAFASNPKMNAMAVGNTVYVSPEKIRSDDANQLTLNVETGGTLTTGGGSPPRIIIDNPRYREIDPEPPFVIP